MLKYSWLIVLIVMLGCDRERDEKIDVVIQNIGSTKLLNVRVEFSSEEEVRSGILISGAQSTHHEVPVLVSQKVRVVVEDGEQHESYGIDLGKNMADALSSGYHILYFQVDQDRGKVLFKRFYDSFPHDVLFSGETLSNSMDVKKLDALEAKSWWEQKQEGAKANPERKQL